MIAWLFLILQLLMAGFFLYLCVAFVTGGPFVPSNTPSLAAMIRLAHLRPGQTVIDIGSGDGRVLFEAAKHGARAIGIELNPYLVAYTRLRAVLSPYRSRIQARWGNLWKTDLSEADVVFLYLIPWRMEEMAAKLKRECRPGTLVISNSFIFPKWKSLREDAANHVYVFRI